MDDNTKTSSISECDLQKITLDEIAQNLNKISQNNIAVWRKNIDNVMVTIPMSKLEQYLGDKSNEEYIFYIEKNWEDRIDNTEPKSTTEPKEDKPTDGNEKIEQYGKVEKMVKQFRQMSIVEREEILDEGIEKLSEQEKDGGKFDITTVMNMVEVTANTFYANNANLEDRLSLKDIKHNIYGVLVKTNWIIQIIINIFENKKYPYNDYKIIEEISTGSITIDHINKVLLGFITFCLYYNDYIDKGFIAKNIRSEFKKKYVKYYKKFFPKDTITIEVVFKDGIRRIDTQDELLNYSIGALLYDIGKLADISYHDSLEDYNERIVKQHVPQGYNMIIHARKYPFVVLAMAAFHHEYYGGKGSYNFTQPLLSRIAKTKNNENMKYLITTNEQEFKDRIALAYFPCKILEIIDVYDALVSKRKHTTEEALTIMKKDFIQKSLKIDPILFRIFMEFKVECSLLNKTALNDIDSI